jgi:hypothetical protein
MPEFTRICEERIWLSRYYKEEKLALRERQRCYIIEGKEDREGPVFIRASRPGGG